ncbi:hypothetical protein MMC28_002522 [Mycoblastus sanguinarius]|nr:hypothetical protein [Mycoblastus sanguinarius]
MTVTYRDGVAILQLAVYAPCLIFVILLNIRHGFSRSSGWFFLIVFTLLRIVGAICRLVSITHPSTGVITAAIVCNNIGLSPLTLLLLGLLARVNDFTTRQPFPTLLFRGLALFSLIGFILGIVGGTKLSVSSNGTFTINPMAKVATIIFLVVLLAVIFILCILAAHISRVEKGERRILLAVAICSPFVLVRLIYSVIGNFDSNDKSFNSSFGNITIYLCMAVLEEIAVVITCIAVGLTLRIRRKEIEKTQAEEVLMSRVHVPNKDSNTSDYQRIGGSSDSNARLPRGVVVPMRKTKKVGPISWLIGTGIDYYRAKKYQRNTAA